MVVQYAFLCGEDFLTVLGSLKAYKQNVVAAIICIDVMGCATATPIFEHGTILKIGIFSNYDMLVVYSYVFSPEKSIPDVV